MCYSQESSIISFLTGGISSIYLLYFSTNTTNKHIGLFFVSVCLIQLLEFLIWTDQKCGVINTYASKFIQPIIISQILSILLGSYLFNTTYISNEVLLLSIYLTSIYLLFLYYEFYFMKIY